jgi:hypothetical protein
LARRRISRLTSRASLRRRAGQKSPRSITLIVCEGETEQVYFRAARNHFGLTTAEVVIADNTQGSAPASVVACAEDRCKEPGGYDKVFCVFDRDTHESFHRARDRIKYLRGRTRDPLPIDEILSIPCFEIWVLLHYEQSDAPFGDCSEVVQRIRNAHIAGYQKADINVVRALVDRLVTAVANAEWLAERAADNNYNPFTAVHLLIQHLREVGNRQVNN